MNNQVIAIMGSGPLGLWAGASLLENSTAIRVRFGNTRGQAAAWLPAAVAKAQAEGRVAWQAIDALNPESVLAFAQGSAALIHCANPRYYEWAEKLPRMQNNAIAAALAAGARLICADNLYAFAPPVDGPLTEKTPENPISRKGGIRKDMHRLLRQAQAESGLVWSTVQASDYFGPGATDQSAFGDRFADPLLKGKAAAFLGDPRCKHAWAYAPDFGKAMAWLALTEKTEALNQSWILPHISDTPAVDMAQAFLAEMDTQKILPAKTPRQTGVIPRFLLRILGLFNPIIREVDEMLYQFYMDFRAEGSAFSKISGIAATSQGQAIQETVRFWRETKQPSA